MSAVPSTSSLSIDAASSATPSFCVFEFFAGLGGFHLSLPVSLPIHSITAIEIDRRAAECYTNNLIRTTDNKSQTTTECLISSVPSSSSGIASPDPELSVRSRIKANRKIFFAKQKQAAEEERAKKLKTEEGNSISVAQIEVIEQTPPAAIKSVETGSSSVESSLSASGGHKLLVSTTRMSSAPLTPPSGNVSSLQPSKPPRLLVRLIEQLDAQSLVSIDPVQHPTIWCMSPPCQPFTHTKHSLQRGGEDNRNRAFDFLLDTLVKLPFSDRPQYLFLENVKHFWASPVQQRFAQTLRECGYTFVNYLLSPLQIGIPNNRTRFYCAARKLSEWELSQMSEEQWKQMMQTLTVQPPGFPNPNSQTDSIDDEEEDVNTDSQPADVDASTSSAFAAALPKSSSLPVCVSAGVLADYLDPAGFEEFHRALILPLSILSKPFHLSVVSPFDTRTFCFTGGYGKVIHTSSGSFLLFRGPSVDRSEALAKFPLDKSQGLAPYAGSIRFFSPCELLRLFGFPAEYRFPHNFTVQNCYKLIGNSINVRVVSAILRFHLAPHLLSTK